MDINIVKEYWDNQPCNINHSSKNKNTKKFFEEVEKKKYFVESHIPKFTDFFRWKGKKVLEIGCGIGTDAINFAKNGAIYTGIELSDKSLDITKKRFELYNLHGKLYNINCEKDLSFLGLEEFDLIYSFGVIHHSPREDKIIENVHKLLKKDGIFKLMLYAKNSWKKIMIDNKLDQYEAQDNCPIARTYTNEQVYKLLKNFYNINILQTHIFPYKVELYKQNIYEKEEWFKAMDESMFNILEKKLGWHLCITCSK